MNRLVTFGCSLTYGAGLEDCMLHDGSPGPAPSKFAWPSCLGKDLNVEVVNNSEPGSSNFQILHSILNFDFSLGDRVIVMWSYVDRDMVYTDDGIRPIGAWQRDKIISHWLALHNFTDRAIKTWYCIHHASLHLKHLNLKYHNCIVDLKPLLKYKPKWFHEHVFDVDVQKIKTIDLAQDNMHPGPTAHKELAYYIGKIFNEH